MTSHKQGEYNFTLDDSKGCYVEVLHEESGDYAYFGVNLNGTDEKPYARWRDNTFVTDDGLTNGTPADSFDNALQGTCQQLIADYQVKLAKERFDPKVACEDMHERIKQLEG